MKREPMDTGRRRPRRWIPSLRIRRRWALDRALRAGATIEKGGLIETDRDLEVARASAAQLARRRAGR